MAVKQLRLEDDEPEREPARPVTTLAIQGRTLPHSIEAEENLISGCLLDEGTTIGKCIEAGIAPESFYDPKHSVIYEHLLKLHGRGAAIEMSVVAEELKKSRQLDPIGGYAFLMRVSKQLPTTAQASYFIERVREQSILRNLIRTSTRTVEECYTFSGDIDGFLAEQMERVSTSANGYIAPSLPPRGLSNFKIPADTDRSVLLGHRYLNRGDGAVLVGTSGMGKSALCLQLAITWALGRECFGVKPNGPLRSLILQSEDSDGDIAEMWVSMSRVMGLTKKEIEQVDERVKIVTERVHRGLGFVNVLRTHAAAHRPDLVWINPLQAFMDGDVTDSQDLGTFLRGHLNRLNADFAYFLVHHTTKPATGKDRAERLWHEVMYDMAGGAEIINWARAIMSLRPSAHEGDFNLVLAKRGRRAGVSREVPQGVGFKIEPVTTIPLKHSKGRFDDIPGRARPLPAIFWEPRPPDERVEPVAKGGGRPAKYTFDDYRNLFPKHDSPGMEIGPLCTRLSTNLEIKRASLYTCLRRWTDEGAIETICPPGLPNRYRLAV